MKGHANEIGKIWVVDGEGQNPKHAMNTEYAVLAQQAWEQAGRYADFAMAQLLLEPPDASDDQPGNLSQQWVAQLRIRYLFPQLSAARQSALLLMFWQRQLLTTLIEANRHYAGLKRMPLAERVTRQVEQKYMGIAEDVQEVIGYDQLTPLQRLIFRQYFCEIPLSEAFTAES